MNAIKWLLGAACEMLTLPDPNKDLYNASHAPLREGEFYARNYYDAARRLDGTTSTSNIRSVVHTGHNRWKIEDE